MAGEYLEPKNTAEYNAFFESNKGKPMLVYLTATWCGPCRAIAPVFTRLAGEYPTIVFIKVDVDNCAEVPIVQSVTGVPSFYGYDKSGNSIDNFAGANPAKVKELAEKLKAL
ncbi:hypothetical protein CYY_006398 [Polysphondylium violaceum]|uniref:Thioredoxin domain-containing protein n=1 Tax=Polysphondylium violaceum TaxID=133409 RepID=A0A8J4PSB3_9MYCE|nr:hypothetical protein CYY_006398 [Polysphondylium violaceum]